MKTDSLPVVSREIGEKPKYSEMAALVTAIEKFYEDPENERAFREWMKERAERAAG